jgi:hypothetical protein
MEAKTLIENLIEAIGEITRTCEDANGPIVPTPVAEAIADAKESASLAKLILPSLDARTNATARSRTTSPHRPSSTPWPASTMCR